MAKSDEIYAPPAEDEETKEKRLALASALWKARQSGKTKEEAIYETGAEVPYSADPASGDFVNLDTQLTPEQVNSFAERLYAGKYDKPNPMAANQPMNNRPKESMMNPPKDESQPNIGGMFKGLDDYARMQNEPLGSRRTLSQTRSLESEGGRMLRMARKLDRMGFGSAAEQMALGGAKAKLSEPNIKTQEYRERESMLADAAKREQSRAEEYKRRQLKLNENILSLQEKDVAAGKIPKYFGQSQTSLTKS